VLPKAPTHESLQYLELQSKEKDKDKIESLLKQKSEVHEALMATPKDVCKSIIDVSSCLFEVSTNLLDGSLVKLKYKLLLALKMNVLDS
jgi:hypothetical protein